MAKISSAFQVSDDDLKAAGGLADLQREAHERAVDEMLRRDELRFVWSIMETLGLDTLKIPHGVRCRAVPHLSWCVDPVTGDLVISRNTDPE